MMKKTKVRMKKTKINMQLAKDRGLTKHDINKLKSLHKIMDSMVCENNIINRACPYDQQQIKSLRKVVRSIEFIMQDIWGFQEDANDHTHWWRFEMAYNEEGTQC